MSVWWNQKSQQLQSLREQQNEEDSETKLPEKTKNSKVRCETSQL